MGSAGCRYHLRELNSAHGESASPPALCDAEAGGKSSALQKSYCSQCEISTQTAPSETGSGVVGLVSATELQKNHSPGTGASHQRSRWAAADCASCQGSKRI